MIKLKNQTNTPVEKLVPWLVFMVLLIYTYAKFTQHPYLGFRVDLSGQVIFIFNTTRTESELQVGDRIVQINSIPWQDFRSDLRKMIFPLAERGQVVMLIIERDGYTLTIPWAATGPTMGEISDLAFSEGWLAFFFWLAGTITLLNVRPKDDRWYLFIAFNYLTSLFFVFGSGPSFYHIWESAIFLRMVVWLCLPVYLHLHWIFPQPFQALPRLVPWIIYISAVLLAIAEWFQLLPPGIFYNGFLLAIVGSILLLLIHAITQPETRQDLRLLLIISLISFLPSIATGIVGSFIEDPSGRFLAWIGGGALLSLPMLPLVYFYALYRRRLGKMELRINLLITKYIFFTLLSVVLILPISLFAARYSSPGVIAVTAIFSVILTGVFIVWAYPLFENFIEYRFFGIVLPSKKILERYSAHITTSVSITDLVRILHDEILSSLVIRQFAFLHTERGIVKLISILNVEKSKLPQSEDLPALQAQSGIYFHPDLGMKPPFEWIRLILPLKQGDQIIGFWLFGRRDPDDLYHQSELLILQSLANQTAVALSNILQTEHLKAIYAANINRYEEEKKRLALDLHDGILNRMASLLINSDIATASPHLSESYQELIDRVRDIISAFRPPMLNFGLKFALEDIADKLSDIKSDGPEIVLDIQANSEWKYPEIVENHIYRIVQEASNNAVKHSHATTIWLTGRLDRDAIDLIVKDDGIGLDIQANIELEDWVLQKHFGLAGIYERAYLINAEIKIDSKPGSGTKVHIFWNAK
jgi:signal transduction histidine kinase